MVLLQLLTQLLCNAVFLTEGYSTNVSLVVPISQPMGSVIIRMVFTTQRPR
jgi:hypothetical protein